MIRSSWEKIKLMNKNSASKLVKVPSNKIKVVKFEFVSRFPTEFLRKNQLF